MGLHFSCIISVGQIDFAADKRMNEKLGLCCSRNIHTSFMEGTLKVKVSRSLNWNFWRGGLGGGGGGGVRGGEGRRGGDQN